MFAALPLASIFLTYVAFVGTAVAVVAARSLSARVTAATLAFLVVWLGWAGILGYSGLVGDQSLPVPGVFILLAPIIAFVAVVLGRSSAGWHLASRIPLAVLIGFQAFRIGVELTLHRLWELGSVPKLMTLAGGNVEIVVGISAPLFAWIATRGQTGRRIALVWNVVGLASLLNVAARAVLSAPGPLNFVHGEVLHAALGTFPYTLIPGFMAPLAMVLHVLTFRALRAQDGARTPAVGEAASALG